MSYSADTPIFNNMGYDDLFSPLETKTPPSQPLDAGEESRPSPGEVSVSLDTMAGEWGDIFSAGMYQNACPELSPRPSFGNDTLALSQLSTSDFRFNYFLHHVRPPFIVPWDEGNWVYAKLEMAGMGDSSHPIAAALAAVEDLYRTLGEGTETANTLPAYFTAKATYALAINTGQMSTDQIFVATFLLCCFEVVAQQETISSTLKQKDGLISTLQSRAVEKPWSPLTQRIIIWLHLFHAKAMHLGGRGILSPNILAILEDQQNAALCVRNTSPSKDGDRNVAVQSLQQSLFQFYFELQRISILAASMNRHHRPRGGEGNELEVDSTSSVIERRLHNLWQGRPWIFDCSSSDLTDAVRCSEQDLSHLALLVKLCAVSYHAEIIYYARSHGRANMSSQKIQPARATIRALLDDDDKEDSGVLLHQPALAWPLFLYSVESRHKEEVVWALRQFDRIQNPLWHTDFIRTFIRDLTAEQLQRAERVDSRLFCVEKYGVVPPFI